MTKVLPLGIMNYKEIMENNYYIVDKTLMIKDFLYNKRKVTLITRPRRFGKTLNMSMMAEFFDITKNSKEVFRNTKIMNTEYASEINQWPTIFISFAGAKNDKESIIKFIKLALKSEYERYGFIFEKMSAFEQSDFDKIIESLMNYNEMDLRGIDNSISFLMKMLEKYYHKKVMLFIDEYDTPFIESHIQDYYQEIKGGLSSLLHNSLKLSSSLQYAMMTGIQRVAKENIFSDLNNLVVCTVADQRYSKYFGFNEKEVEELLQYYGLTLNQDVKEMYDGYQIGKEDIYNPWSIINYADNKQLIPYWVNTSANIMIKSAIKNSDNSFHQEYERLIQDGELETQVMLETSFYESSSTSSLWGLLVNAGYLTIKKVVSSMDSIYKICIPNQEVQREFINLTEYYLSINDASLSKMFRFLIEEKKEQFIQEYTNILMLPSYHDLKDENSYHMMMLGMCVCLSNEYEIRSNREQGKGRCDIVLKAKKTNKPSYVFEFKYRKENNTSLDDLANEAVKQITDKKYDYELCGKIIYIGLAHAGKEVVMKWVEKNK